MNYTQLNSIQRLRQITERRIMADTELTEFLTYNIRLQDSTKGLVDFKPTPEQRRMLNYIQSYHQCALIGPRQIGISSAVLGYLLYEMLDEPDQTVVLAAPDIEVSRYNLDVFLKMLTTSSFFNKSLIRERRKHEIILSNNSRILANTGGDGIRGLSISYYFHDNALLDHQLNYKYDCCLPAISNTSGKIILGSCTFNSRPNCLNKLQVLKV